jgi:hypothetical protein
MDRILTIFVIIILITACNTDHPDTSDPDIFYNNFDVLPGYENMQGIKKGAAHSGRFSMIADTSNRYSKIFRLKFKDISDKKYRAVQYSVWCYAESAPMKGNVVASVNNEAQETVVWNGTPLENSIIDPKTWVEIEGEVDLSQKDANNAQNEFVFYVWNTGNSIVYADDVTLHFID